MSIVLPLIHLVGALLLLVVGVCYYTFALLWFISRRLHSTERGAMFFFVAAIVWVYCGVKIATR